MKKRESTFLKLDWPFKTLGKRVKKVAIGIVNFIKNDELNELSDSLERAMGQMSESLEKIKKSTEKYREHSEIIMAQKRAEQNLVSTYNELATKTRELKVVVIKNRHRIYLQNRIWQNRLN